MSDAIKAVILGGTGYVGGELLRLIAQHPRLEFAAAVSESKAGEPVGTSFGHLANAYASTRYSAHDEWIDALGEGDKLALFSAAPHGASAAVIAAALYKAAQKNLEVHVVDSSADFRYSSQLDYEAVYGRGHGAPDLLDQFSSGLPEHVSEVATPHVGHPGCFATATLLAAVPLVASGLTENDLFVTGITGSTGSGNKPRAGTHHPERHSNLYAYNPLAHRHTPEMVAMTEAATGRETKVNFVPHSGPFTRGIYITVQAKMARRVSARALREVFAETYADAPFVNVSNETPRLKNVVASNYCHIGVACSDDTVVVMSAIDNLVKGAAGGAVQWMNRLWGLPETEGLAAAAPAWT